jgi:hypothetical protein
LLLKLHVNIIFQGLRNFRCRARCPHTVNSPFVPGSIPGFRSRLNMRCLNVMRGHTRYSMRSSTSSTMPAHSALRERFRATQGATNTTCPWLIHLYTVYTVGYSFSLGRRNTYPHRVLPSPRPGTSLICNVNARGEKSVQPVCSPHATIHMGLLGRRKEVDLLSYEQQAYQLLSASI